MTQVAVDGQLWNYVEFGGGKQVPLVILHGWGRSGREWEQLGRELAQFSGRKVYVLDLPGFGGSSIPRVATMEAYAELVSAWVEYMGIKEMMLLGHSLGGRVGIILGAKHHDLIEQLILIDPAGVKPKSFKRVLLKAVSKVVPSLIKRRVGQYVMDGDYRNSPALRDLYRVVVAKDLRAYLPRIRCKTWVIWGEKDPILPLKLVDIYKNLLPHPVVRVIWGAGHDPHLTHYRVLKRILEEALWIR